jgi:hypothetical protein
MLIADRCPIWLKVDPLTEDIRTGPDQQLRGGGGPYGGRCDQHRHPLWNEPVTWLDLRVLPQRHL